MTVPTFISSALGQIWRLFNNIRIPYFGFSFASFFLGLFAVTFSIHLFRGIFSVSDGAFQSSDSKHYNLKNEDYN